MIDMMKREVQWPLLVGFIFAGLTLVGCDATTEPDKTTSIQADKTIQLTKAEAMPQHKAEVVMYKSPNCDCCTDWADHLRQSGFTVVEHQRDDMDNIKSKHGVTKKLASCHTAIVDGYVIEGHVPAADIARLLKQRPKVVGLTAPGMPMQSPGMQKAGLTPKNYDVLAFDADGTSRVFTHY